MSPPTAPAIDPARAAGRRARRHADRHRPRVAGAQSRAPTSSPSRSSAPTRVALCRAQPPDQPPHRCRSTCRWPTRCARRARRSACWRSKRRWTSWPTSSASTRSSCASRNEPTRGSREERAVLDPPAGALPAGRRAPLRLGQAQPAAGPGARRPLAGRHGHGRGHPRQLPAARPRPGARWTSDGVTVVEMAMTDIGTGTYTVFAQIAAETARPAGRAGEVRARRQLLSRHAGLGRLVRRGELRRCGAARCRLHARLEGAGSTPGEGAPGACTRDRPTADAEASRPAQESTRSTPTARISPRSASTRHRRGAAAPHAGRVRRRPHPQRQDGALAADRRHDLGRRLGAARGDRRRSALRLLRQPGPRRLSRAGPRRHPARSRRSCCDEVDDKANPLGSRASASSASAAPARRSPTPSTTPAACACATIRSRSTRCCRS